MCTAVTYKTEDFYFGRNFDYEKSYGEVITVMPRNFDFPGMGKGRYALVGAAHIALGTPLFFDAVNEKGLACAALNFKGNAYYKDCTEGKKNLKVHEVIPYILRNAENTKQAIDILKKINICDEPFSEEYPVSELHWIFADKDGCFVLEPMREEARIYENTVGVLTNNPPFLYQMFALNNYLSLTSSEPENRFGTELSKYSRGMGAIGLPGDFSSQSRFIRAAFVKLNSVSGTSEKESVSQLFHILSSVAQVRGCVRLDEGLEFTLYSSCMNTEKGIYYYRSYDKAETVKIKLHKEKLDGDTLTFYPM